MSCIASIPSLIASIITFSNSFSILERDSSQQEQLPLRGQEDPVPIANNIAVLPARLRIGETYFREEKQRENNPKYLPDLMIRKGFSYNHCYRRA